MVKRLNGLGWRVHKGGMSCIRRRVEAREGQAQLVKDKRSAGYSGRACCRREAERGTRVFAAAPSCIVELGA